jgi:hypothetical protein
MIRMRMLHSLISNVAPHVDFVSPVTGGFPPYMAHNSVQKRRLASNANDDDGGGVNITPKIIRHQYGIPDPPPSSSLSSSALGSGSHLTGVAHYAGGANLLNGCIA